MSHLLIVSLGPVQEFIATARRTRDLYAGSQLLSLVAGTVAGYLGHHLGYENLIFPAPRDVQELQNMGRAGVANVVLARVEGDPRPLAEGAVQEARAELRQRAEALFGSLDSNVNLQAAVEQVDDLLEVYWAATPWTGQYAQARERVYALLEARKATRDFRPVTWGGHEPKSSLDGARETVLVGDVPPSVRARLGLRPGEHLSGVDLLKRRWAETEGKRFASTVEMAARPFLDGLDEQRRQQVTDRLRELVRRFRLKDGHGAVPDPEEYPHLLYPSRWRDFMPGAAPAELAAVEREVRAVYKKELKLSEPHPYYALLAADGDHMGAAIDRLAWNEGMEGHRRLSRALVGFAAWAADEVVRHRGSLVYSGGDDVLALLPLHTALDCAASLSAEFARRMVPFASRDRAPTLSVGIAITHFLEPLQDALALARRTEREAKERAGRNALAVAVSPRSGGEISVHGSWSEDPNLATRLRRYAELFLVDAIPDGAAFQLEAAARILGGNPQAAMVEARRILRRKRIDPAYREELDRLLALVGPERLARELVVARHLVPALRLTRNPESLEGRPCT